MRKPKFRTHIHPLPLITILVITLLYFGTGFLPASEKSTKKIPLDDSPGVQQISKPVKQKSETGTLELSFVAKSVPSNPSETSAIAAPPGKEIPEQETIIRTYTFQRGDSLSEALSKLGLSNQEVYEISKASKSVLDPKKIRSGHNLSVTLQKNSLRFVSLRYAFDLTQTLKVERVGEEWLGFKEEAALTREIVHRVGTITHSFYASAKRQKIPIEIILKLSDIFAWDIDFGLDIRKGDQFKILYEVFKKEGVVVRSGRVLAAELINRGRSYPAYYFDPNGEGGDYYDEEGRSLKKAFLKSPLRYRYISSGYTRHRLHPILKVNRPHLGIDFAAARGTPVRAASDGIIAFAGWKGGNGKTVIIRHKNGYETLYGHLSSYWAGIKKGKRVKQEDFIGRVGSSGLSTGPHLHYTLIKDGRAINPNKVALLRGESLDKKQLPLFFLQLEKMDRMLYPPTKLVEGSGTT